MSFYSRIKNETNTVEKTEDFAGKTPDDPRTQTDKFGSDKKERYVPYIEEDPPAYDPTTHRLERVETVTPNGTPVDQDEHRVSYTVVELSSGEELTKQIPIRMDALRPAVQAAYDRLRPADATPNAGAGEDWSKLNNQEKTDIIRYLGLCFDFDA